VSVHHHLQETIAAEVKTHVCVSVCSGRDGAPILMGWHLKRGASSCNDFSGSDFQNDGVLFWETCCEGEREKEKMREREGKRARGIIILQKNPGVFFLCERCFKVTGYCGEGTPSCRA